MAYSKEKKEKRDYYQEVTNDIIAAMEKGELPFQKAWDAKVGAALMPQPISGASGRAYTKENAVRLAVIMNRKASDDPRFYTFAQAKKNGWSIRKGSKGTWIKCGFYATKDIEGNDLPQDECHWTKNYLTVFHATDCCASMEYVRDENGKQVYQPAKDKEGTILTKPVLDKEGNPVLVPDVDGEGKPRLDESGAAIMVPKTEPVMEPVIRYEPIPEYVPSKVVPYTHEETMDIAETALQGSGAVILHDQADRAFYRPSADEIHLPPKEAFPELAAYYATALHELGHWTGHESRLNRNVANAFGTEAYAKEELRAELASAYLSMDLGIPMDTTNHAAYLQSWLKALKEDKMEIFKAANDAAKIANYVKDLVRDKLKELQDAKKEKDAVTEKPAEKDPKVPGMVYAIYKPINKNWLGKDFMEMRQTAHPLALNQYEKTAEWGAAQDMGADRPMEWLEQNRAYKPGSKFHLDTGCIVQINERLFFICPAEDKDGNALPQNFTELQATKVNDRLILSSVTEEQIQRTVEEQTKQVGKETFAKYQESFREAFLAGAAAVAAQTRLQPEDSKFFDTAYQMLIYGNAVRYGLSSIRPCADKSWQTANTRFMDFVIEQFGADNNKLMQAAKAVQELCPHIAVSKDRSYAMKLFTAATQSDAYREAKQNAFGKEERIAGYGVGR